jgi:hypothetical protein
MELLFGILSALISASAGLNAYIPLLVVAGRAFGLIQLNCPGIH